MELISSRKPKTNDLTTERNNPEYESADKKAKDKDRGAVYVVAPSLAGADSYEYESP